MGKPHGKQKIKTSPNSPFKGTYETPCNLKLKFLFSFGGRKKKSEKTKSNIV